MIEVNGEQITNDEAMGLIKMICNDAKQFAGTFHGENRSKKFRANWPNEYVFADANWKTFMEATRTMYAERLGDPLTTPEDKRRIHLALVLDTMIGKDAEKDTRLQLAPNTQQFVGDAFENKKISAEFGNQSNTFLELAMASTAVKH